MVGFNGILDGMNTMKKFVGALLAVNLSIFLATIVLGAVSGVGQSIDVLPTAFNNTLNETATSYNSLVSTLYSPISIMVQLIIIVVLMVIFFKGKGTGTKSNDIM